MAGTSARYLVLLLCLGAMGCTAGPVPIPAPSDERPTASTSPARPDSVCDPSGTEAIVTDFLADISADDVTAAAALFAEPPAFRWYSDASRTGPDSYDRTTLPDHLASVAAATTTVTLVGFDYNGRTDVGNFAYVLSSTDTDGNTVQDRGKGAVQCSTGFIVVWSQ